MRSSHVADKENLENKYAVAASQLHRLQAEASHAEDATVQLQKQLQEVGMVSCVLDFIFKARGQNDHLKEENDMYRREIQTLRQDHDVMEQEAEQQRELLQMHASREERYKRETSIMQQVN